MVVAVIERRIKRMKRKKRKRQSGLDQRGQLQLIV
mgnify:CR=1 FL=1